MAFNLPILTNWQPSKFVLKCNTDHITHQKPVNGDSFSLGFAHIFDISINIHEYANEMSLILTHAINIFVICGITGAINNKLS